MSLRMRAFVDSNSANKQCGVAWRHTCVVFAGWACPSLLACSRLSCQDMWYHPGIFIVHSSPCPQMALSVEMSHFISVQGWMEVLRQDDVKETTLTEGEL